MRGAIVHIPRVHVELAPARFVGNGMARRGELRESDSIEALRFERAGLADA
jgi:hypothetical protein